MATKSNSEYMRIPERNRLSQASRRRNCGLPVRTPQVKTASENWWGRIGPGQLVQGLDTQIWKSGTHDWRMCVKMGNADCWYKQQEVKSHYTLLSSTHAWKSSGECRMRFLKREVSVPVYLLRCVYSGVGVQATQRPLSV